MKVHHHDLEIELNDLWWFESGMHNFKPASSCYRVDTGSSKGEEIFVIKINDVMPVERSPGVDIFNSNKTATAKERVTSIFNGFIYNAPIPPVEVVAEPDGSKFRYKLVNGTHRLYCSIFAGFSHIPAIKVFDVNA